MSAIVSTHNRCESLLRTLESLRCQHCAADCAYEVIIVDNNSSDRTSAAVRAAMERGFPNLRYVFEPRLGVSYGRNAGIAAARAPIVAFTDDDNEVGPHWISIIKRVLDDDHSAAAVGGKVLPKWPDQVPAWIDRRHWSPLALLDYGPDGFYTSVNDPRCFLTANFAIRRELIVRLGGFSPDFPRCQDHELLLRLWRAGEHARYAPELVVFAAVPPERLTRQYHRRWHSRHGTFAAVMRLEESMGKSGEILAAPIQASRLHGAPTFLYRQLLLTAVRYLGAAMRLQAASAFRYENHMRYLAAYIRRSAHGDAASVGSEFTRFASAPIVSKRV